MSDDELLVLERWDGGIGWTIEGDPVRRTSHALAVGAADGAAGDADLWLCDPVDAPGLDDLLAESGTVAGVVLQLDRHHRDSAAIARRHDVAVHLPPALAGEADDLDCETETFAGELGGTGFHQLTVVDNRFWREAALYAPERGTLVVAEAVGGTPVHAAGDHQLGVHPVLRLFPPRRALGDLRPERVLVGHGTGVLDGGGEALQGALARSRRAAPRVYGKILTVPFR